MRRHAPPAWQRPGRGFLSERGAAWLHTPPPSPGVELLGEVLVHFFGLNQSRFQWAVEEAAQQRERRRQRALEQRQRQELRARRRMEEARQEQDSMEGGAE